MPTPIDRVARKSPPRSRTITLQRWITLAGALLIVAFVGSSIYDAWRAHRQTLAATDRALTNLSTALAQEAARSLQVVDALLRDTGGWYLANASARAPDRARETFRNLVAGAPQVRRLWVEDPQGESLFSSIDSPLPRLQANMQSGFVEQGGNAAGLFISAPIVTPDRGTAMLILSRRVERDGRLVASVNAAVDLEDFQRFYRAINLTSGNAIVLLRSDGLLIARQPPAPEAVGKVFSEFTALRREKLADDRAPTLIESAIDGKRRFVAAAPTGDFSFLVMMSRDQNVALAPWHEQTTHVAVRTLALALFVAAVIAALVRQLSRVETGERALRQSEERYALAMEASNDGHWDWDVATDAIFLSPKMKELDGRRSSDPATTRALWEAAIEVHPDDRARRAASVQRGVEGPGSHYELEYRVRHPDGRWHWLIERGRCVRDESGKALRVVGATSDITARKDAEAEQARLEQQLRQSQKMEAMGTLAGGIAHDFNNILGAIMGYGELAQKSAAIGSATRRYVDQVMHAGGRAKRLVERILAFSRSGWAEREPVYIQSTVEETLDMLGPTLPADVRLDKQLHARDVAVIGDATQLHQVAMNLCTNGMQAMPGGGVLRVALDRVDVHEPRELSHGALAARPYVRLAVGDTGGGIAPSVYERMFDPFFTTKGVGEGTGLGLSLVHGIVADLGGAIDVATSATGTTFAIWLPLASETAKPAPESARPLPRGHGEVLMVVDDEPALVMLAEETLAELGYEPVGFTASAAALAAFRDEPSRFDLVLTDEKMPDRTGTELAREIHALRGDIPVVLMSGHCDKELVRRAQGAGVREVLRKPLARRDIAEPIARALCEATTASQRAP